MSLPGLCCSLRLHLASRLARDTHSRAGCEEVNAHVPEPTWQGAEGSLWGWGKLTADGKEVGALRPIAARKWVLPLTCISVSVEAGSSPVKPPDEHAAWLPPWQHPCETLSRGLSCAWTLSTELRDNTCVLFWAIKFVVICYIETVN